MIATVRLNTGLTDCPSERGDVIGLVFRESPWEPEAAAAKIHGLICFQKVSFAPSDPGGPGKKSMDPGRGEDAMRKLRDVASLWCSRCSRPALTSMSRLRPPLWAEGVEMVAVVAATLRRIVGVISLARER